MTLTRSGRTRGGSRGMEVCGQCVVVAGEVVHAAAGKATGGEAGPGGRWVQRRWRREEEKNAPVWCNRVRHTVG